MENFNFFQIVSFTQIISHKSSVVQFMDSKSLTACVQLYIPRCTDEQINQLLKFIFQQVIEQVPLRIGHRRFIYCRYNPEFTDACILSSYTAVLQAIFGSNTRAHARIFKKGGNV